MDVKAERKGDVIHLTLKGGKFLSYEIADAKELRDALTGALKGKATKEEKIDPADTPLASKPKKETKTKKK